MATRKSEIDYKWEKDNCTRINLKIRNDSGLVEVIDKVRVCTNDSRNSYIIAAVREKLIRDGYLSEETEKSE